VGGKRQRMAMYLRLYLLLSVTGIAPRVYLVF
jgi:hypothetical protein